MKFISAYATADHLWLHPVELEQVSSALCTDQDALEIGGVLFTVSMSPGVLDHIGDVEHIEYCAEGALASEEPFAIIESTKAATELCFEFPVNVLGRFPLELDRITEKDPLILISVDPSNLDFFQSKVSPIS